MIALRRHGALACALALVTACGGARPVPRLSPSAGGEVHDVGGASVVVLVRPLADTITAQLWIDVGSIDAGIEAGAPETAALAAWIVEARATSAGSRVRARVVPDGTVLEASGTSLEPVITALLAALATRDPTEAELTTARERLRDRRRGRARDPLAALEARSVALLFGAADPLGLEPAPESSDRREVERDVVASFLRAHYGPRRARLVVVGALEPDEVTSVVGDRFLALPDAEHDAPMRRVIAERDRTAAIEEVPGMALAVIDPRDADDAPLGGAPGVLGAPMDRAASFVTPCGTVSVVARRGLPDTTLARSLAFALAAGTAPAGGASLDERGDAEREGLRFVGRAERCASPLEGARWAMVVAAEDHAERALAEVDAVLEHDATPPVVTLDVDGHTTALMLVLEGGAAEDPPRAHGRAHLLGRAIASRCGLTVRVEPERVVASRIAEEGDVATLGRALSCALIEPMPPAFLAAARGDALDALGPDALGAARAALAIAPGAPGIVAPLGSPEGIAAADALEETLARWRSIARARIALAAPETLADAAGQALSRALGSLPPGDPPPALAPTRGPDETFVAAIDLEQPEVIVTLHLDHEAGSAHAATAELATRWARELAASPLTVVRAASGSAATVDWIAITVTGTDEAIDAIDGHLARARERITPDVALLAEAASRPGTSALDRLEASLVTPLPAPSELATATLLRAPARRVIVRPSAPSIRRR